jgi:hypothetical protein
MVIQNAKLLHPAILMTTFISYLKQTFYAPGLSFQREFETKYEISASLSVSGGLSLMLS